MYNYKQLDGNDLISESYKQINENTEALRRNFEGDSYPLDPVKGQLCFINGAWCTFDGSSWKTAADLHNHNGEYFSKAEVEALLASRIPETASRLTTPVMIGDQAFDGSADIQLLRKDNVLFLKPTFSELGKGAHASGCTGTPASCGYGEWSLQLPAGGTWLYYDYGGEYMGFAWGGDYVVSTGSYTAKSNISRACQNPLPRKLMCIKISSKEEKIYG